MRRLMFIESSLRRSPSTDAFVFDQGSDAVDFVFGEVGDLLGGVHVGPMEQRERTGPPDAVDIGQTDLGPLLGW